MAAGLGSRFGGTKQLADVGPNGEAFLDFSIRDGAAAGFDEIVIIVRTEIADAVQSHVEAQHPGLAVTYVVQDEFGPQRAKPWGTLHAVLSAQGAVSKPFAVINADDYYGQGSFQIAAQALQQSTPGLATNVAFELAKTVPSEGSVTRAVTEVKDGFLTSIVETEQCQRLTDGTFSAGGMAVPAETPVSMNLWCFDNSVMADFAKRWEIFYEANKDEASAEAQLPTVVGELMDLDLLRVAVKPCDEQWIGITNPADYETAKAMLATRSKRSSN